MRRTEILNGGRMRTRISLTAIIFLFLALVSPLRAEFRMEKNLKLDPGGQFVLESDLGSVTVTGSPPSGANIVITSKRDDIEDLVTFDFADGPGTARVTAHRKHGLGWHTNPSVHSEIR